MTSPGLPLEQRHVEGAQDERRPQVGSHRPSDDASAEGVQHDGKEQEARPRGHVGDIGDPQAVGPVHLEIPVLCQNSALLN